MSRLLLRITMALVLVVASVAALEAQDVRVGAQASFATGDLQGLPGLNDAGPGLGARAAAPLADLPLIAIGAFDYFFPGDAGDADIDYWELNGNLGYLFEVSPEVGVQPYLGGGAHLSHLRIVDRNESELGLNLLGGALFPSESLTPFVEIRMELRGGEQFALTGGILF